MFIASLYNLKGGVGKTASSVNFAYMAAKDGYRTLLWDLDPQGAAGYYYHAHAAIKSSVKKIIEHELSIHEAILPTPYDKLNIIPADNSAASIGAICLPINELTKVDFPVPRAPVSNTLLAGNPFTNCAVFLTTSDF